MFGGSDTLRTSCISAMREPRCAEGRQFRLLRASWRYNQSNDTFNTLNGFTFKGDAPPRIELVFDPPDGLGARRARCDPRPRRGSAVSVSEDGNRLPFELRPEARFHDGTPLTADDVVFSFETLKAHGHPDITQTMRDVTAVPAEGRAGSASPFRASRAPRRRSSSPRRC